MAIWSAHLSAREGCNSVQASKSRLELKILTLKKKNTLYDTRTDGGIEAKL